MENQATIFNDPASLATARDRERGFQHSRTALRTWRSAANNPLLTGDRGGRFHAGALLAIRARHALGTFRVIESAPRLIDARPIDTLKFLATLGIEKLEPCRDAVRSVAVGMGATPVKPFESPWR